MQEGTVPDDWRCANVTPIFKKGKKADPGNYRPVSLSSIPCKLMDSLNKDRIMDHLIENELILFYHKTDLCPGKVLLRNLLF